MEEPAGRPVCVDARFAQDEAVPGEAVAQVVEVGCHSCVEFTQGGLGKSGNLDLATGLETHG